jgi:DNA polymerase III epsilon subunit-like protein
MYKLKLSKLDAEKYLIYKDITKEIYKIPKLTSMKNLKQQLTDHLIVNGIERYTYRELYELFPFDGWDLSNKQQGDRVRSIWKKIKKSNKDYYNVETTQSAIAPKWVTDTTVIGRFDPESKKKVFLDELDKITKTKQPKILIYDLETSPLSAYVWSLWKQNVNPTNGQLRSQKMILSWSAKWLYKDEILFDHMLPSEIKAEDDSNVAKSLWELIDKADIVIAHNASGFDVKIMNTRFLMAGLNPPRHYQVIDTLLHARKRFKLESNKLDYLGQVLGLGKKYDTGGFQLWVDCMKGCSFAMSKMVDYCNQDVKLLEAVYLKLRPWIKPHPALNLITDNFDKLSCPSCNSVDVADYGTYTTYASVYKAHKCNSCHSTFRSRSTEKVDKSKLTISTPN